MKKLSDLINSRELDFESFFKMHPFSVHNAETYLEALEGFNYFNAFHIKTIEMYARLAQIASVLGTRRRNLVIITGYVGCGKTNFLNYISHIASGGKINKTLNNTYKYQRMQLSSTDDQQKLDEEYKNIKIEIFNELQGAVNSNEIDGIALNQYLENCILSYPTYINFDKGGFRREKPLSTKLYYSFEYQLKESVEDGKAIEIISLLDGFVKRNASIIREAFEQFNEEELLGCWNRIKLVLDAANQNEERIVDILPILENLTLEHLLLVFFLWEYTYLIVYNPNEQGKLLYLLDNIDILTDGNSGVFRNTIFGIFSYICNSRIMFSEIRKKKGNEFDEKICNYYSKTNIIIAMRETSAMKITDHVRKIVGEHMVPYDISEDIDKQLIIRQKLLFAKKLIKTGEIKNEYFIAKVNYLEWLLKDSFLMARLFQLNNDDVRTSIQLISKICEMEISSFPKVKSNKIKIEDFLFGRRGIVLKRIFEIFNSSNYLRDIKINTSVNRKGNQTYPYSSARIILVLLYKQRVKQADRIYFNPAEYVELKTLYSEVSRIMSRSDFIEILDGMYSLRNSLYWNHLITFDNVQKYSSQDIAAYLDKEEVDEFDKVYVCITPAGKAYLDYICIHYEYFNERFPSEYGRGLFDYDFLNNASERNTVKEIIDKVFKAVRECCRELAKYNRKVLKLERKGHYSRIISSQYNYAGVFHEERLVHNHISYLNAYRNYLIAKSDANTTSELEEISDYLIIYIKKYLDLLHTQDFKPRGYRSEFFSERSKKLYNTLMVCIEKYKDTNDWDIDFTSSYYNQNYAKDKLKCSKFIELGLEIE